MRGLLFLTVSFLLGTLSAQDTLLFKPDYKTGKDAYLRSLTPDENYGTHTDFAANAWTNSGREVLIRGIIDFELNTLSTDLNIRGAYLSLYSYDSNNGRHSTRSGSNEAVLRRVIEPWEEDVVTWNNQPAVTEENQVFLDQTTSEDQDYLNIDVTEMVKDMVANPNRSFGFRISLITEEYYRRMMFTSSDNVNPDLHPALMITYVDTSNVSDTTITSLEENEIDFTVYPNPSTGIVNISNVSNAVSVKVFDTKGSLVIEEMNNSSSYVDLSHLQRGIYFIQINQEGKNSVQKIVLDK